MRNKLDHIWKIKNAKLKSPNYYRWCCICCWSFSSQSRHAEFHWRSRRLEREWREIQCITTQPHRWTCNTSVNSNWLLGREVGSHSEWHRYLHMLPANTQSITKSPVKFSDIEYKILLRPQGFAVTSLSRLSSLPFSHVPPENRTGSWRSRPPGLNHWSWQRWRWGRRRCPPRPLGTVCSASGQRTWNESLRRCCSWPLSTAGCVNDRGRSFNSHDTGETNIWHLAECCD